METVPPPRPTSLEPAQLGFTPQPAVRWFSPGVLTRSALHVAITAVLGSFLDKRELQTPTRAFADGSHADGDELWFDYAADTGDGFAATATVAHHLGRRQITLAGSDDGDSAADSDELTLPRGRFLVLGGDEVYPMAESKAYDDRMVGPWRAALPFTEQDHPGMYAIPGNHDWLDGLTGFLRLFAQDGWIGGWQSRQDRSYFALQLPHHWWLWGLDIQSEALIDRPQIEYFTGMSHEALPGDKLIIATAVPAWTDVARDPRAYDNLNYLERTVIDPAGLSLRLLVAGDRHYYGRYRREARDGRPERHLITAGGGGAFLHPTHELPATVRVPAPGPVDRDGDGAGDRPTDLVYERVAAYPDRARSRWLSLQAAALPLRNWTFMPVTGLVTVALLWAVQFGLRSLERRGETFPTAAAHWGWTDLAGGLFRSFPSLTLLMFVLAGLFAFARTPAWAARGMPKTAAKLGMAVAHLALQVLAIATVLLVAITVADPVSGWWFGVVASLVAFALGGVVGALVVGLYLTMAVNMPGVAHANEAFAAARLPSYKNFLRFHIDTDGRLTVYAVGIDRAVPRRAWRPDPHNPDPEAALITPDRDPPRRLIERI